MLLPTQLEQELVKLHHTAQAGKDVESLLSLGVGSWAMPLFGGFDGLDVTEIEPFRRGAYKRYRHRYNKLSSKFFVSCYRVCFR